MNKGDFVHIKDGSEWDGQYGIVDRVVCGVPWVLTVYNPTKYYWVTDKVKDKVNVV